MVFYMLLSSEVVAAPQPTESSEAKHLAAHRANFEARSFEIESARSKSPSSSRAGSKDTTPPPQQTMLDTVLDNCLCIACDACCLACLPRSGDRAFQEQWKKASRCDRCGICCQNCCAPLLRPSGPY